MGYGEVWKVLDNLIIEFRKRGESVPSNVIEDLRAAKTMIQVLKADPNRTENIPSIEMYLSNVESYLVFVGQQKFGDEFYDRSMAKLREARETVRAGGEEAAWESASKFVPGIPRGQRWVRVQVSDETPEREIEELASECGLSTKKQTEGFVLVYGEEEKLKLFVQKTGEKLQKRRGL